MPNQRYAYFTTQTAGDKTFGKVAVVGVNVQGLDAATTLTLLDGTAIKYVAPMSTTTINHYFFGFPVSFQNLIIDATGTGNYSLAIIPTS